MDDSLNTKGTHVDDFIDDIRLSEGNPAVSYAQFVFNLHRLPAVDKYRWAPWIEQFKLYCTYKNTRYRVTGCSRLGDIWLATNFNQTSGYDLRVDLDECSNWSDTP